MVRTRILRRRCSVESSQREKRQNRRATDAWDSEFPRLSPLTSPSRIAYAGKVGGPRETMAAFAVFIRESTLDPAEMEKYFDLVGSTLEGHPHKVLAAYGRQQILEGSDIEGAVIIKFPSIEAAKAWYDSPEYQEAREHRFKGATYRAVIVEGLLPWEVGEAAT
jgi:uncharacterized protein (DUF1330 family)